MKQFIHRVYVVFLLALLVLPVAAQRFINVSFEGAHTVCAITQDAQGMMWIGTDNGLYSYDGYHGDGRVFAHVFLPGNPLYAKSTQYGKSHG